MVRRNWRFCLDLPQQSRLANINYWRSLWNISLPGKRSWYIRQRVLPSTCFGSSLRIGCSSRHKNEGCILLIDKDIRWSESVWPGSTMSIASIRSIYLMLLEICQPSHTSVCSRVSWSVVRVSKFILVLHRLIRTKLSVSHAPKLWNHVSTFVTINKLFVRSG